MGTMSNNKKYTVILQDAGGMKLELIKVIIELTGLGLKEAKDISENTPKVFIEGISNNEAEKIKEKLIAAGATVEIKEELMDIPEYTPMTIESFYMDENKVDPILLSNNVANEVANIQSANVEIPNEPPVKPPLVGTIKTLDNYEKSELRNILLQVGATFKEVMNAINGLSLKESAIINYENKFDTIRGTFDITKYLTQDDKQKFLAIGNNNVLSKQLEQAKQNKFWKMLLSIPTCLITLFLIPSSNKRINELSGKLNISMQEFIESKITELETQMEHYENIINDFEKIVGLPPVSLIPQDYRDTNILVIMAHYLENMEASTWKECVAAWKNDIHREEVMAKQEQIRKLTEQTAISAAITAENAAITAQAQASIETARSSAISATNSNRIAQNTAKTARNTNKIRKSTRNANIISVAEFFIGTKIRK